MVGERKMVLNYLVSAMKAFQLIRSGCEAYLANVIDITVVSLGVSDVPIVNEFLDVFWRNCQVCHLREKLSSRLRQFWVLHLFPWLHIEWHQ